jgi:hypothetical protein
MIKILSPLTLLIVPLLFAGELPDISDFTERQMPGVVTTEGKGVLENDGEYYGKGFLLGRPVKASLTGIIFKTYELIINEGGFTDNNLYLGSNTDMSTDSKAVFDKFQKLDANQMYVFEYIHKSGWNPEIENSNYQVTAIYSQAEFIAKYGKVKSKGVTSGKPFNGSQGDGVRRGRVTDIERTGFFGNFCMFELNTGGLKSSGGESLMVFTVMDEEVCKWIEQAMVEGRDIEVDYVQDIIEAWQPSDYFANGVKFAASPVQVSPVLGADGKPSASPELIEAVAEKLVNDPKFVEAFLKKLQEAQQKKE